jgi:hypothetical protein
MQKKRQKRRTSSACMRHKGAVWAELAASTKMRARATMRKKATGKGTMMMRMKMRKRRERAMRTRTTTKTTMRTRMTMRMRTSKTARTSTWRAKVGVACCLFPPSFSSVVDLRTTGS